MPEPLHEGDFRFAPCFSFRASSLQQPPPSNKQGHCEFFFGNVCHQSSERFWIIWITQHLHVWGYPLFWANEFSDVAAKEGVGMEPQWYISICWTSCIHVLAAVRGFPCPLQGFCSDEQGLSFGRGSLEPLFFRIFRLKTKADGTSLGANYRLVREELSQCRTITTNRWCPCP